MQSEANLDKQLILETSNGIKVVSRNALLLFVDETGEEEMRDPNHPVFGLGGILASAKEYTNKIRNDWIKMKKEAFDGKKGLHACDISRTVTEQQIAAFSSVFTKKLGYIAVTTSARVENLTEYQIHHMVSSQLISKAKELAAKYCPFDELILIFEESQRGDRLIKKNFAQFDFNVCGFDPAIFKCVMPKSALEPGLEIADFVMHTAGSQTRINMNLENPRETHKVKFRKDFDAMFKENKNASFFFITKMYSK